MPETKPAPVTPAAPDPRAAFEAGLAAAAAAPEGAPAPKPSPAPAPAEGAKAPPTAEPASEETGGAKVPPVSTAIDPASLKFEKGYPSKSEQWKEVKLARERAEAEATALRKQLDALGDIETLKKQQDELAELKKAFREVAIERDPEFVAQFTSQRKSFIADAREAAGEQGDEVAAILDRHGANAAPYIRELAKKHDWDQVTGTMVAGALSQLKALETNRAIQVATARDNWDKHQHEQTAAQRRSQERAAAERTSVFESYLKSSEEKNPFLQKREGAEDHNAAVDEAVAVSKRVVSGDLDADELARVALMAGTYNNVLRYAEGLTKQLDEARAELLKLRGAAPGAGGGAGAPSGGGAAWTPPKDPKNLSVGSGRMLEEELKRRGF
jgi:hypothetical protein